MTDFLTDLSELRTRVSGPVLTVDDDGFAEEASGENLALLNTPDVVVGATSTEDVVEALRLARDLGLRVRVQSTGHGAAAPITDGLLVSTRRLDTVSIDADERVATVGAGARWRDVVAAAGPLGLAPVTGSSPGVGVVGYLTGGGYGPLIRSHGVSSDRVRGLTVVDGRGEVLTVSAEENADLFWALRGGKSGLGIVTEVRVELVELPELYAGSLMFEGEHIDRVLRGWLDYTRTAPDGVSTSLALMSFPPIDKIPEPMRGKRFASVRFAFPGPSAEGEELAAPLRDLAPVFQDEIGPSPSSTSDSSTTTPRTRARAGQTAPSSRAARVPKATANSRMPCSPRWDRARRCRSSQLNCGTCAVRPAPTRPTTPPWAGATPLSPSCSSGFPTRACSGVPCPQPLEGCSRRCVRG
jgi:hypothetical protein